MSLKVFQSAVPPRFRIPDAGQGKSAVGVQKPAEPVRPDPLVEAQKTAIQRAAYHADTFEAHPTRPLGAVAAPIEGLANGLADTAYRSGLRTLMGHQLAEEKAQQEHSQAISELFGDTAGAADAARKLGGIRDEQLRRSFEGARDLGAATYRQDLKGLSLRQLEAEERKHFGQYVEASVRRETTGAEAAQQKLAAIHDELRTRSADQERITDPELPAVRIDRLGSTRL